jgi:hypothetical protein
MVFLWSLVNFRGYIVWKSRMFVNDTEEWKKETLVNSKVLFQKVYKKTTQTHTRFSANVIHWNGNMEYLTLLWSTATFNICLQCTDNYQAKLVFYKYYSTNFTVTSTYQLQNKLKKKATPRRENKN